MVAQGEDFAGGHGPADEDDVGELELVDDGFDVAGAAGGVMAKGDAAGLALGARVHGDDATGFLKMADLEFEDVAGHEVSGNKQEG